MILDSQRVLTFSYFLKFGLVLFLFWPLSFKIFYFDPSYLNFLVIDLLPFKYFILVIFI